MSKPYSFLFIRTIGDKKTSPSQPIDPPDGWIDDGESAITRSPTPVEPSKSRSRKGQELLSKAKDSKLKNTIGELYRPGASVGDGGTADAIRQEKKTGKPVGGKSHIMKGRQRLKNLENLLKRKDLSDSDRAIAKQLYDDLKDALGDK